MASEKDNLSGRYVVGKKSTTKSASSKMFSDLKTASGENLKVMNRSSFDSASSRAGRVLKDFAAKRHPKKA